MVRVGKPAVVLAMLVGAAPFASPGVAFASSAPAQWVRPVPGAVVRPFEPPSVAYGPGHLGVDFAAAPGTPVHAAGAGVVTFAGHVGTAIDVVVLHRDWRRTTYAFLRTAVVHRGDRVGAGGLIGATGGTGENHDGHVLHFGLRDGSKYVDPMQLFAPVDLPEVVHLAPLAGRGTVVDGPAPPGSVLPVRPVVGGPPVDAPPRPHSGWWRRVWGALGRVRRLL